MTLDNPFWSALDSIHREVALRAGEVARYPAAYAPFLGVASADATAEEALDALVAPGESVYLIGIAPAQHVDWTLQAFRPLAQMVCDAPLTVVEGPGIVALGEAQRDDVLALTALVYPHYFRERTMELGRYFGIYEDGRLAAMIGERMGSAGSREMRTLARGVQPFLHVSHENPRAKGLYEQLGYRVRRDIGFWSLKRADR